MNWIKNNIRWIQNLLGIASFFGIFVSLYYVFMLVPNERIMGPVQRIFYFHVGSAIACYVCFAIVFIAGLFILGTRDKASDAILHAAGEVGFILCSIVLITGMIWGNAAWNTPFRWEPRLVSFLLLWFIFLSFNLLRSFGDPTKVSVHSAVLGILGAATVPLVILSIKLLPQTAQLHPQVIEHQGLQHPLFKEALLVSMLALVLTTLFLLVLRTRYILLEDKLTFCEEA